MKKILFLALSSLFLISCSNEKQQHTAPQSVGEVQNNTLELVDVRIYEDGRLKINGSILSESSLESHLNALPINTETNVRVSSSNQVYTGLVTEVTRQFAVRNISNLTFNMMTPSEFADFENALVIDVLSNGKIMMDGNILFPADLGIVLKQAEHPEDLSVILSVSEEATFGPVTDVQKILHKSGAHKISYTKTSS